MTLIAQNLTLLRYIKLKAINIGNIDNYLELVSKFHVFSPNGDGIRWFFRINYKGDLAHNCVEVTSL